jgi:hypothetical protein
MSPRDDNRGLNRENVDSERVKIVVKKYFIVSKSTYHVAIKVENMSKLLKIATKYHEFSSSYSYFKSSSNRSVSGRYTVNSDMDTNLFAEPETHIKKRLFQIQNQNGGFQRIPEDLSNDMVDIIESVFCSNFSVLDSEVENHTPFSSTDAAEEDSTSNQGERRGRDSQRPHYRFYIICKEIVHNRNWLFCSPFSIYSAAIHKKAYLHKMFEDIILYVYKINAKVQLMLPSGHYRHKEERELFQRITDIGLR